MSNKPGLDDQDKKHVVKLLYGLSGRHFNKAVWGHLYQNEEEVEAYSYGQILTELAPNLHLVGDQVLRE